MRRENEFVDEKNSYFNYFSTSLFFHTILLDLFITEEFRTQEKERRRKKKKEQEDCYNYGFVSLLSSEKISFILYAIIQIAIFRHDEVEHYSYSVPCKLDANFVGIVVFYENINYVKLQIKYWFDFFFWCNTSMNISLNS